MLNIIANKDGEFAEIEVPIIILDMAFGKTDAIVRHYPPFKCQMLCLVMKENATSFDISSRLEYYFSKHAEKRNDPGLAIWTDER
jgi:hypothetical protein